ncbi:hypothetical protein [Photobacterium leiognathi]|uniref:hypothetical protein n=1 Tax=Photobacterium leiognathi TaxID=553611 RepID=UPI002981DEBB|nr:hypothetical protein [Photobacterium leiognathi]
MLNLNVISCKSVMPRCATLSNVILIKKFSIETVSHDSLDLTEPKAIEKLDKVIGEDKPRFLLESIVKKHTIRKKLTDGKTVSGRKFVSHIALTELRHDSLEKSRNSAMNIESGHLIKMSRKNIKLQLLAVIGKTLLVMELDRVTSFHYASDLLELDWSITASKVDDSCYLIIEDKEEKHRFVITQDKLKAFDLHDTTEPEIKAMASKKPVLDVLSNYVTVSSNIGDIFKSNDVRNNDKIKITSRSLEFCYA